MELRNYQIRLSKEAAEILQRKKIVYLAMEVRTGKTITALQTAENYAAKNVLFLTKLKAFSSVQSDYDNVGFSFKLTIANDESLHKISCNFDLVIHDEHHRFGAFPKPNATAKLFKKMYGNLPMIFLSGTPTAESYSQWYHQFWVSNYSPFEQVNFYKWANDYVNVKVKHLGHGKVNDYTDARKKDFWHLIRYYILTFTQVEAGFSTQVNENVLYCDMDDITYKIIEKLKKDLVVQNKEGQLILADTSVKLQQKLHQLYSGTCKFEDGTSKVIDLSKAMFIDNHFKCQKIAIFYKFVEEFNALKNIFGNRLTNDLEEFNTTDKNIALQIVSGREGISLAKAKYLVYYNIDFSAVSYWQSRDRLTTMDRKVNDVYWIFSKDGIESKIYASVIKKKDYNNETFKRDFGIKKAEQNNQPTHKRGMALR
ncbi:MAG: DEAD/DEAH box helicase family protein [Flavobacterium macrobrachii]